MIQCNPCVYEMHDRFTNDAKRYVFLWVGALRPETACLTFGVAVDAAIFAVAPDNWCFASTFGLWRVGIDRQLFDLPA